MCRVCTTRPVGWSTSRRRSISKLGYKNRPEVIAKLEGIWRIVYRVDDIKSCAMSALRLSACMILLNGFPGVGKLTIARCLQSALVNVRSRLIDNHLMIDPAEAIYPGRGAPYRVFRDRMRQAIFDDLKALPEDDIVLIMTCSLGANFEDAAVFAEYLEVG